MVLIVLVSNSRFLYSSGSDLRISIEIVIHSNGLLIRVGFRKSIEFISNFIFCGLDKVPLEFDKKSMN